MAAAFAATDARSVPRDKEYLKGHKKEQFAKGGGVTMLQAHQQERVPAPPPVLDNGDGRTESLNGG